MIYKLKIRRVGWYKNPMTGKYFVDDRQYPRINRENVIKIIENLKLKSVSKIKQNKKPYITVMLSSLDEYRRLVSAVSNRFEFNYKRMLSKYK